MTTELGSGPTIVRRRGCRRVSAATAVFACLEAEGVDVCFGLPGGAALPLYDALAQGTSVRHVLARHEQGAGHMAQGYARVTGRPGVTLATSGPGATNLVTPIADAQMDSTPLVCITGQVRSPLIGTQAFQECDIVSVVRPLVKGAWQARTAEEVPDLLGEAFATARSGRPGPVLVDLPRDVQEAEIALPDYRPRDSFAQAVDSDGCAAAARLIARAERPVLYVGGGVVAAGASTELRALAERGRIPVVQTLMAKGAFPERHPLFAGWPGMHGPRWSNLALGCADLVIAVGARFDDRVTGRLDAFAPAAAVIHVDADPREISKLHRADVGIVGDARTALSAIERNLTALVGDSSVATALWLAEIWAWRGRWPLAYQRRDDLVAPQALMESLDRALTDLDGPSIVTTGVGQHQMWAMQYIQRDRPREFVTSGGHGTMGFGIPAAVGARAARPDATVVCVDGDGSFQMTNQELATAVAEDLPIVVVLVDNGTLGMVYQWQTLFHERRHSHVGLRGRSPDYLALARAYGARTYDVCEPDALAPALAAALAGLGTAVVRVEVDPAAQVYPMIPPGAAAVDCVTWQDVEGRDPD